MIRDWLVDKFAIAGTFVECRAQIERIKKSGLQIAIILYSPPSGSREETIHGFAKAMG